MTASPLALSDESIAAITSVAAEMPFAAVCCFESPSPLLADIAHTVLAAQLLDPDHLATDAKTFSPEGERWKVAELDPAIATLALAPLERHVLGLWDVHRMDRACFDKLLKVCEEPPAPSTVCWSTPQLAHLPTTLRSRISSVIRLEINRPQDLESRIEALGLDPSLIAHPALTDILVALATSPTGLEVARRCTSITTPASNAHELLSLAAPLAKDLGLPATTSPRRLQSRLAALAAAQIEAELCIAARTGTPPDPNLLAALNGLADALEYALAPAPHLTNLFLARTAASAS